MDADGALDLQYGSEEWARKPEKQPNSLNQSQKDVYDS